MKQPNPVTVLHTGSAVAMAVFVYLFIVQNQPGLTSLSAIIALGGGYCLAYLLSSPALFGRRLAGLPVLVTRLLFLAMLLVLPLIFLNATVWDYYQPLSLFDDAIASLAVAWILLLLAVLLALIAGNARMLAAAVVALLGPVCVLAVHQISNPQPATSLVHHSDIFVGGQDGYDIYRIPGLLVIPAGSVLANGSVLVQERLLAFAEARVDGALDTGAIDLVQKSSDDGGITWSSQAVVCEHRVQEQRGKCGNPTPLFDSDAGSVWLAYNLSGIPGDQPEGPRPHSAHLMRSDDGGTNWLQAMELPFDNMVFGPGHGIQKQRQPQTGRLLLPAYSGGTALAVFSDDHGDSWQVSDELGVGNESEIAELSDGRLYMATRHAAPIGRPPQPNGRLYAISADGGSSWLGQGADTALPTPVCQASVVTAGQGEILFANPAHGRARVRMTIRASNDDGVNWSGAFQVYPGPAGYSQLGVLGNGDIILLYERGRMAYSERISFARLKRDQLF